MSKLNNKKQATLNKFETDAFLAGGAGAPAAKQDAEALLRRAVMASLLWEDMAYESGDKNSDNIASLIPKVKPEIVANIAVEARVSQKLRHVPLYIAAQMAKHKKHKGLVKDLLPQIITRADQLTDFLAIYWKQGRCPLANSVKKGLAKAFERFDAHALAKYNRDAPVKLKDVMFLTHPRPADAQGRAKSVAPVKRNGYTRGKVARHTKSVFTELVNDSLAAPDTWEVALSAGADKKEVFTRLINERKLGGLAMLRNLRNMVEAGVSHSVIKKGLDTLNEAWLLPLNFFNAAREVPTLNREIEEAMLRCYKNLPKLPGHTVFIVDVSGSMWSPVSAKSKVSRMDAAAAMATLAAEQCERISVYATASEHQKIKPYRGFALSDEIVASSKRLGGGGIYTRRVLEFVKKDLNGVTPDRIIIFSDSQDCEYGNKTPSPFGKRNYICDVSAHKHGINYKGLWTAEISGWSEHFLTFIGAMEGLEAQVEE